MDAIVRAIAPKANLRFVVVNNTETVREIAKLHGATGALLGPLADVIGSAQLLATQLKGAGAVSLEIDSDGLVPRIGADSNPFALTRATLPKSLCQGSAALDTSKPLIGEGTLTVNRRLSESGKQYRSIVEIISPEIAKNVAYYLEKSEQIRTAIGLGCKFGHEGLIVSGGFMVQILPGETSDADLAVVEDNLAKLPSTKELFTKYPDPEAFLEVLASGFEIEIMSNHQPQPFCPCSREGSSKALAALGHEELQNLIEEGEALTLNCDYCRSVYNFTPTDLRELDR